MRRVWTWLLARPKPSQPPPRIITIGGIALYVGLVAGLSALPHETALRAAHIFNAVLFSAAFIAVACISVRMWARRRRSR